MPLVLRRFHERRSLRNTDRGSLRAQSAPLPPRPRAVYGRGEQAIHDRPPLSPEALGNGVCVKAEAILFRQDCQWAANTDNPRVTVLRTRNTRPPKCPPDCSAHMFVRKSRNGVRAARPKIYSPPRTARTRVFRGTK